MTDEKRLFRAIHYNLDNEPEETFSYIYEKYKPLLMFIASRYLKSETDIEDIVHNTFVEFFNNLDNIHTTIKSYLSVCCKTNALDYLRAKGKVTYVETEKLSYLVDETTTYDDSNDKYKELIKDMKLYLTKEDITNYEYLVITNRHVIENSDAVKVYLHTIDEEIDAELIHYDDKVDMAIVKFRYDEYIKPLKFSLKLRLKSCQVSFLTTTV